MSSLTYQKQPVDRIGQQYSGNLIRGILTAMDRELLRVRALTDGGGGITGSASSDAPFVTMSNVAELTAERALAVGGKLTRTDGGANASVTLDVNLAASGWAFPDTSFSIFDASDPSTTLVFSLAGATSGKGVTIISNHTDDRSITLPDATCTLAGLEISQIWPTTGTQTFQGSVVIQNQNGGTFTITGDPLTVLGFTLFDINTSFSVTLQVTNSGLTADRVLTIPNADGDLLTNTVLTTLSNKTLGTSGNYLRANTSSNGVAVQDNTDQTKLMRWILSTMRSGVVVTQSFEAETSMDYRFPNSAGTVLIDTCVAVYDDEPLCWEDEVVYCS